jgi:hypothetical protein
LNKIEGDFMMRQPIVILIVLIFAAFSWADEPRQSTADQTITEEQALQNNLIPNGDFEIDDNKDGVPDEWAPEPSTSFFTHDKSTQASGQKSWKITGGGVRWLYGESKTMAVEPNTPYTLFASFKQDGPPAGDGLHMEISWKKTDGTAYGQYTKRIEGQFDWTKKVYVYQSPSDATSAKISIVKDGSTNTVWFDQVVFAKGIIKKTEADLTLEDQARGCLSYEYLLKELNRFLVPKEAVLSPAMIKEADELRANLQAGIADVKKTAKNPSAFEEYLVENSKDIYFICIEKAGLRPTMAEPWYDNWLKISTQVADFRKRIDQDIQANQPGRNEKQAQSVFGENAGYGIGVTDSLQKVLKEQPYIGPIGNRAGVALARNEHEGFQVVVLPFKQDLNDISITVGDLKADDGTILKNEHIKVFPVGYVFCNDPETYTPDYLGWWPDPLLVDKTFSVKRGENQPAWIDVFAPADQKAGVYKGEMVVAPANGEPVKLHLEVTVWNYALPKKGKFKVLGRFMPEEVLAFYKWKEFPKGVELKWNLFQVEHRYSPTGIYSAMMYPNGKILEECIKAGLNTVNVSNFSCLMYDEKQSKYIVPYVEQKKVMVEIIRQGLEELKKYDALDIAYLYCFDELHDLGFYPTIRDICQYIKAEFPDLKISTTTTYPPIETLVGSINTWVPLLGMTPKELTERQKAGDEVFFYIYGDPRHPFPNAANIEFPGLDGRISFWVAWQKGWNGFLYWRTNGYEPNYTTEKRWPEIPWIPAGKNCYVNCRNGEGYLIYPGPNGEPLSSVRFEIIRDGIEDWEAMYILRELAAKAEKLPNGKEYVASAEKVFEQIEKLVPNEYDYDMNPANLQSLRNQIARTIEQLQTAIEQKP